VPTGRRVRGSGPVDERTWIVDFSRDGRWLLAGGGGAIAYLWDVRRRKIENTVERSVLDASLSPDGAVLALTLRDDTFGGGLELFSVPDLTPIRTVRVPPGRYGRFAAGGRSFVYGDRHGRVWVLDARTWKPRHRPLDARGPMGTADLSRDGRRLVTTHLDGTARLWDVASGRQIGGPLPSAAGDILAAAFTGAGAELAVMHEHGGYVWDARPESWEQRACAIAGRRLTRAEWRAALPGRDYAPAC
jgi:WD40 repeat protein